MHCENPPLYNPTGGRFSCKEIWALKVVKYNGTRSFVSKHAEESILLILFICKKSLMHVLTCERFIASVSSRKVLFKDCQVQNIDQSQSENFVHEKVRASSTFSPTKQTPGTKRNKSCRLRDQTGRQALFPVILEKRILEKRPHDKVVSEPRKARSDASKSAEDRLENHQKVFRMTLIAQKRSPS